MMLCGGAQRPKTFCPYNCYHECMHRQPPSSLTVFVAIMPLVYLLIGMLLDALLFTEATLDTPFHRLLIAHVHFIDVFEVVVLLVCLCFAFPIAYSITSHWQNRLSAFIRPLPFIDCAIALLLGINLWFLGAIIALLCALYTGIMLYKK